MESSIPSSFKTEWWFKDDLNKDFLLKLRVDEESSSDELEDEIEYWLHQISIYGIDGAERKAIMGAVRWMMMLMENQDGN